MTTKNINDNFLVVRLVLIVYNVGANVIKLKYMFIGEIKMKKILSLICTIFMSTMILVGCTSNKEDSKKEEQTVKTVSTIKGDIKVPSKPKRVVANWYVGDVISLGLNLVGYNGWAQETMPFYKELSASTKIQKWEPEEVMALQPDLIITYDEKDFDKFSKIAPVLVIPEDVTSTERLKTIGETTGSSEKSQELISKFEQKLSDAKKTLKSDKFTGKTFSILEDWGPSGEWSGIGYETGSRGGTLAYKYLELKYPDKLKKLIEEKGEGRSTISYEVAHEYFGDYILWFEQQGKESEYKKSEIWKSIPAVAAGHVIDIPGNQLGLFYYSDVASLTAQIDYMVNAINSLDK